MACVLDVSRNMRRAFSEQPELVRLKWMVAVSDAIFSPIPPVTESLSDSGTISRTRFLTRGCSIRLWSRLLNEWFECRINDI